MIMKIVNFIRYLQKKGYPEEKLYEIKKIDLLLDALKGQKEINREED